MSGVEAHHRALDLAGVAHAGAGHAVERSGGGDGRVVHRQQQRHAAPEAESGHADPVGADVVSGLQRRHCTGHVDQRVGLLQGHHQFLRLVGLGGDGAVEEVGRQRDITLGGDSIGDVADVGI